MIETIINDQKRSCQVFKRSLTIPPVHLIETIQNDHKRSSDFPKSLSPGAATAGSQAYDHPPNPRPPPFALSPPMVYNPFRSPSPPWRTAADAS